jgi:hypothetical protein
MAINTDFNIDLSVVLVGRNDNYGGNFKSRLEYCISLLFQQLQQLNIHSEIIFVNYNPLPAPGITDFIQWPASSANVQMRIIEVPHEEHLRFVNENKVKDIPVIEYLAKNVGIRRAKGKFISCINPDIIFPDEFISQLAHLDNNCFYRANRFDFVQSPEPIEQKKLLEFAKANVIAIWMKGMSFHFSPQAISQLRYIRYKIIQQFTILKYEWIRKLNVLWKHPLHFKAENKYHCNVSGDFMLMSRKDFFDLNGYFETAPIALHIDSLFVVQAAVKGLKESMLKFPIYHQDHERRYTSDRKSEIEDTAYLFFQKESEEMITSNKTKQYNSDNWGLKSIELNEQYI